MGNIREQDFRIKSTIETPIAPIQSNLYKVGFVFFSEDLTEITEIKTKEQYEEYIKNNEEEFSWAAWQEQSFFAIPYSGPQDIIKQISAIGKECFILIFSQKATHDIIQHNFDWWGIYFLQNTSSTPWEEEVLLNYANKQKIGVFCDPEKEGKAFYTVMQMLSLGYPYFKNIKSDITPFTSIFNTLEHRDALIETSFSWYKDTKQGVSIWDVFVGGFGFKSIMGLYIADDECKNIYTQFINAGKPINASSIGEIEVSIGEKLTQLVEQNIIDHFSIKKTPPQSPANLVKGIVKLGEKECGLINEYNLISYSIKGV